MEQVKTKIYDFAGKSEPTQISLPTEIFGLEVKDRLLAKAVKVFLSNQRTARAKALRRGEVSGSGKKIWRQKGTGRARHGDKYAPIFVGGGVAHGPTGSENWKRNLSRKERLLALKMALSQKFAQDRIIFVNDLAGVKKTKEAMAGLKDVLKRVAKAEFGKKNDKKLKIGIIFNGKEASFMKFFRNIAEVELGRVESLNPYLLLNNNFLVFTKGSLLELKERMIETRSKGD